MAEPEVGGIAAERLKQLVERIERLTEEKDAIAADIRDIFAEAKGAGFDVKIMRQIIKLRRMHNDERQEQQHLLELYCRALGMEGTPLGDYGVRSAAEALVKAGVTSVRVGGEERQLQAAE